MVIRPLFTTIRSAIGGEDLRSDLKKVNQTGGKVLMQSPRHILEENVDVRMGLMESRSICCLPFAIVLPGPTFAPLHTNRRGEIIARTPDGRVRRVAS